MFPHPAFDARVELEDSLHDGIHKSLLQVLIVIPPLVDLLVLPLLKPLIPGEGDNGQRGFTCRRTRLGCLSICPPSSYPVAASNPPHPHLGMSPDLWGSMSFIQVSQRLYSMSPVLSSFDRG